MIKPTIQLYQGEALRFLTTLPDNSVDAVITDPPYSSGGAFRSDRMQSTRDKYQNTDTEREHAEFGGDNRDQRAYRMWCTLWMAECYRIAKPGALFLCFTDWRQLPTTTDAFQAGGWMWRGLVPWDKTEGARPQKGGFRNQCEFVVWGSKGRMRTRASDPCLAGCFRHVVLQTDKHHAAGKPTALLNDLIKIVRPGGVVLDPFMGSGTTGVAAKGAGLGFIGCETEAEIFEVAERRIHGGVLLSRPGVATLFQEAV
jgi:site-specific DNA-methyltransferase (adenine-specific)